MKIISRTLGRGKAEEASGQRWRKNTSVRRIIRGRFLFLRPLLQLAVRVYHIGFPATYSVANVVADFTA
jgi:hypothetical protein